MSLYDVVANDDDDTSINVATAAAMLPVVEKWQRKLFLMIEVKNEAMLVRMRPFYIVNAQSNGNYANVWRKERKENKKNIVSSDELEEK